MNKWRKLSWRLTLQILIGSKLEDVRDWFLRFVYAQHNARVIVDFENRMSAVLSEATGHLMSKSYYDADTMLHQIGLHINSQYDDGYVDGRKDLAEELGVEDPSPVELER